MHEETKRSISGHLRVEERAGGERKWIATYVTHKGPRTRTLIGLAWVRDTGRRTQRGGKIWRAGDGTCPDGFLTPAAARAALEVILETERAQAVRTGQGEEVTVRRMLDDWLTHLQVHGGRHGPLSPVTLRDYVSIVKTLKAQLGANTPIAELTAGMCAGSRRTWPSSLRLKGASRSV